MVSYMLCFLLFLFPFFCVTIVQAKSPSHGGPSPSLKDILISKSVANKYLSTPQRRLEAFGSENCPPGKWWEEEFWGDECHNCGAGKYQNQWNMQRSCKDCGGGQYQNSNGQSTCNSCPAGQYQNSNSQSHCKQCPFGYFQDQAVQTSCKSCPKGWTQPSNYGTGCNECPIGRYQTTNIITCSYCGIINEQYDPQTGGHTGHVVGGEYQDQEGQTNCKKCIAGRYQTQHGQGTCTYCPAGFYNSEVGLGSTASCKACTPGYFSPEDVSSCTACPRGYFVSGSAEATCTPCAPGFYQDNNAQYTSCKGCGKGMFQSSHGAVICIDCAAGRYQDATSQDICKQCPIGQFSDAVKQEKCKNCPAGTSSLSGSSDSACVNCPVGYYLPDASAGRPDGCLFCAGATTEGSDTCTGCAPGKAETNTVPPTCENCPFGQYGDGQGCLNCPAGYYQKDAGKSLCIACTAGKWSSDTAATSSSTCQNCPMGKYSVAPAAIQFSSCTECNPGYYNPNTGQNHVSSCKACLPGKFALNYGRTTDCSKCAPGRYSGNAAATSECMHCPGGWYQESYSQSACKACLPGKRQASVEQTSCDDCAAGRYNMEIMSITCTDCDAGFYQAKTGQILCFPCMVGKSQESKGMQNCATCEEGRYRSGGDNASDPCKHCPRGYSQSTLGAVTCVACNKGTYSNQSSSSSCLSCSSGMYMAEIGKTSCKICPRGHWTGTKEGASSCQNCPAGKSGTGCKECNAGQFRGIKDSPTVYPCLSCPSGWFQGQNASSVCLRCIPGFYAKNVGSRKCLNCPSGWLQGEQNGTSCLLPPPGSVAGEGGSSTVSVAQGWRINHLLSPPMEECPRGTIGDTPPSNRCLECPPGKDSEKASTLCHACEVGRYASAPGTSNCIMCDRASRMYSDTSGAIACKVCPPGKTSKSFPDGCIAEKNLNLPRPFNVKMTSNANATDEVRDSRSATTTYSSSVHWESEEDPNVVKFDIVVSTTGDFDDTRNQNSTAKSTNKYYSGVLAKCEDESNGKMICVYDGVLTDVPLWRKVLYVQVRSVGSDHIPGSWSTINKFWQVASDCSNTTDDSMYLSLGKSHGKIPSEYSCKPCPVGGSCSVAVIASDVVAMFGWWQCSNSVPLPVTTTIIKSTNIDERGGSVLSTIESISDDAPSFSVCGTTEACLGATNPLLLDAKGRSPYVVIRGGREVDLATMGGPDVWVNGSRCGLGYRNPSSRNRRCADCEVGFVRAGEFGTCVKCPDGVAILLVPLSVIFASLLFIALLVALKVRSTGSKRAPHTVLRRTLLHHLQTLAIILSLNVKWPEYLKEALSFLSAVVSTSDHLSMIKCSKAVADRIGPTTVANTVNAPAPATTPSGSVTSIAVDSLMMGQEATFFYTILVVFLLLPGILSIFGYLYWVYLSPYHKCFRCGIKLDLRASSSEARPGKKRRALNNINDSDGMELTSNIRRSDALEMENESAIVLHANPLPHRTAESSQSLEDRIPSTLPASSLASAAVALSGGSSGGSAHEVTTFDNAFATTSDDIAPPVFYKNTLDCAVATAVLLLYLFYPSLVRMAFSILECETVCGDQWLHRDQQEPCWVGRHLDVVLFCTIPSLLIFLIVFPCISTLFLWRRRYKLYHDRRMTFRFGMLYSGYRKEYWWWELLVLLRKFTIILIVTFGRNFGRQLHVALGALVIFYHFQHTAAPFPKTKDGLILHKIELESIIVLLIMTWVAVFFTVSHCEDGDQSCRDFSLLLGVVLIIANIIFLGKALWYTAKKLNEKEKIVNRLRSGAGRLLAIGRQSIRKPTSNINKKKNNGGKRGNKSDPIVWSSNVSSSNGPAWKNESDVSSIALGEKCLAQPSASAVRHLDPSTGKYYYHDTVTKETWWEEDSTL